MFGQDKKKKIDETSADFLSANIIINGTSLNGHIESAGNIRIDGKLEGTLATGGKLVVGKSGQIYGNITCQNASIEGRIEGNIQVDGLLFLKSTAFLLGDIVYQKMVVEEGARFIGSCKISKNTNLSVDSENKNAGREAV